VVKALQARQLAGNGVGRGPAAGKKNRISARKAVVEKSTVLYVYTVLE